ncbi:hypothetical protein [Rhodococcus erythropolis]
MSWGELWVFPFKAGVWGTASTVLGTAVTSISAAVAAQVYRHNKRVDEFAQARQMRVYIRRTMPEFHIEMYNHSEHPIYAMQIFGIKRRIEDVLTDPDVLAFYAEHHKDTDGLMHDDDRLLMLETWLGYESTFASMDEEYDFLKPSSDTPSSVGALGGYVNHYDFRLRFKDTRSLTWYFVISRKVGEIKDTEPRRDLDRRKLSALDIAGRLQRRYERLHYRYVMAKSVRYAEKEVSRLKVASQKD